MLRGRRESPAFTLIEIMISIALLAIMMSIAVASIFQFGGLNREREFNESLENAPPQLAHLRILEFDSLPPRIMQVDGSGAVPLNLDRVVPGSVRVVKLSDGSELVPGSALGETVSVGAEHAGSKVLVSYDLELPYLGETHFIGEDGTVRLRHTPVKAVERVQAASGPALETVADFSLEPDGRLKVKNTKPGQLLVVDYYGGTRGNRVRGQFLDRHMSPTTKPSSIKRLVVGEPYPGPFRMTLSFLKVKQ